MLGATSSLLRPVPRARQWTSVLQPGLYYGARRCTEALFSSILDPSSYANTYRILSPTTVFYTNINIHVYINWLVVVSAVGCVVGGGVLSFLAGYYFNPGMRKVRAACQHLARLLLL